MTKITVGLPVYNGEAQLDECLQSLLAQTFTDFVVEVYDNASTDRTAEIVARYAARDSRIHYNRHITNIGAGANFVGAVNAAKTEYFLWRADDDLASPDFLERLYHKLDAAPDAVLAVSRVESIKTIENTAEFFDYNPDWLAPKVVNIVRRMFYFHPSWIYGVWRTERLQEYYRLAREQYPVVWAQDCLVLLLAMLDSGIVGDNQACFTQRIGARHAVTIDQKPTNQELIATKEKLIGMYLPACRNAVASRNWTVLEKMVLYTVIENFARKRVKAKRLKLIRLKARQLFFG